MADTSTIFGIYLVCWGLPLHLRVLVSLRSQIQSKGDLAAERPRSFSASPIRRHHPHERLRGSGAAQADEADEAGANHAALQLIRFLGILLETELNRPRSERIIQGVFALIASLFGLATIVAGVRVLAGSDPGYIVFRPLLIYNAIMGMAYVAAGVVAWRSFDRGKYAAATIFVLNFLVLGAIGYLYATGSAVAIESLRAMILRTVVWLLLFLGLAWMSHRRREHD